MRNKPPAPKAQESAGGKRLASLVFRRRRKRVCEAKLICFHLFITRVLTHKSKAKPWQKARLNFELYTHEVISWPYTATEFTFVLLWSKNTVTEPVDSVTVYGDENRLLLQRTVGNLDMTTTPHGKSKRNITLQKLSSNSLKIHSLISEIICMEM